MKSLMNDTREGKLVKNTLLLSIGTFLPKLASFVTLPIVTGYLSREEYGTFDLITVMVSLFLPAVTLQIQTAAFRFIIDRRGDDKAIIGIISTIFAFILPISLISLVILWLFLPAESSTVKLLICLYFFVDVIVNATRQIARGIGRNLDYSISAIVSAVGKMLFIVIFVWLLDGGLPGVIAALAIASTISFVFLAIRIKLSRYLRFSCISRPVLKELLAYSWPMVPNSMSMWVMRLSDRLVVVGFMGVAANAVYAVANKIPSLLNLAQNAFTMAWQENASIAVGDHDVTDYYTTMFRKLLDFTAGLLALLICVTPVLFAVFIRKYTYDEVHYQMLLLFISTFLYSMTTFLGGIYVAYKKTKSVGVTTICAAVCNLVIDLALIRKIGLYAASGSTLISYFLLLVFRMIDVKKIVRIRYDHRHIALVAGLLLLECALFALPGRIAQVGCFAFGIIVFAILNRSLIAEAVKLVKHRRKRSGLN